MLKPEEINSARYVYSHSKQVSSRDMKLYLNKQPYQKILSNQWVHFYETLCIGVI